MMYGPEDAPLKKEVMEHLKRADKSWRARPRGHGIVPDETFLTMKSWAYHMKGKINGSDMAECSDEELERAIFAPDE